VLANSLGAVQKSNTNTPDQRHGYWLYLSEISGDKVVGSSTTAHIYFCCGCINQVSIEIEGTKKPHFVDPHIGLYSSQSIFIHEERSLQRTIVAPKPNGASRRVICSTLVRKIYGQNPSFSYLQSFVFQIWGLTDQIVIAAEDILFDQVFLNQRPKLLPPHCQTSTETAGDDSRRNLRWTSFANLPKGVDTPEPEPCLARCLVECSSISWRGPSND